MQTANYLISKVNSKGRCLDFGLHDELFSFELFNRLNNLLLCRRCIYAIFDMSYNLTIHDLEN